VFGEFFAQTCVLLICWCGVFRDIANNHRMPSEIHLARADDNPDKQVRAKEEFQAFKEREFSKPLNTDGVFVFGFAPGFLASGPVSKVFWYQRFHLEYSWLS
jgi:hypothetical protein